MKNFFLTLFVISCFVACSPSTQIVKSWREPSSTVTPGPSIKTLVIALVKDETSRRVIEDDLAKRLKTTTVASYTLLPSDSLKVANDNFLNQQLKQGQFTHILLMRLADIEKETSYVQGTTTGYYGGYGRYYGYGAGTYSSQGYYQTDKNYFIETTVYTVEPNKLIWTGTTKTVNPSSISKTVNDIGRAVVDKMTKDGFLIK